MIKTVRDKAPEILHNIILKNQFEANRKLGLGLLFDSSRLVEGKQSIQKRLLFMRVIDDPWCKWIIENPLGDSHLRQAWDIYSTGICNLSSVGSAEVWRSLGRLVSFFDPSLLVSH